MTDDTTLTEPTELAADSTELSAEDLAALDGIAPDLGPTSRERWATPAAPLRDSPEPGTYLNFTESIPSWHSHATPRPVVKARTALDAAVAADRAARADFAAVPGREAAERVAVGAAAVAGDPIPDLTDWSRERLVCLARHAELARQTRAAVRAYEEAVATALPAWHAALVSEVAPARQRAREAFAGVEPAVRAWLSAIDAAAAIDAATHPSDVLPTTPLPEAVGQVLVEGRRAAPALAALLASDHPVVAGSYLERNDDLRPPRWVRAALNEGGQAQLTQLFDVESREQFRFTDYTRDWSQRYFVDGVTNELRPKSPSHWSDSIAHV